MQSKRFVHCNCLRSLIVRNDKFGINECWAVTGGGGGARGPGQPPPPLLKRKKKKKKKKTFQLFIF